MNPKSLFNIILKIFGLFFLRETFLTLIQLIATIVALLQPQDFSENNSTTETVFNVVMILAIVFAYGFIIYQLLFNTNKIIDLLKLDKGFSEQEFSFNLSRTWVLTIALIVIGGVILTSEIPNFCRNIFSLIQERRLTHGMTKPNYSYVILSAVKVVIGFLLIGERKRVIDFVERKQNQSEAGTDTD